MFLPRVLFDRSEKTIVFDFFDFLNFLTLIINKIELVMIKKFFMLAVAALALVACGDDDEPENPTPEPNKATEFVSTLSMTVSQDLFDVANVTVYYIGSDGQVKSESMGSTEWTKTITQKLPCKYGFAFACAKKPGVTIDEDRTYTFSENLGRSTEIVFQKGNSISGNNHTVKFKDEVIGESVETYLSGLSFSYEFAVDEDGNQTATTIDWGFNAGGGGTTNTPVDDEPATGDAE